MLGRGRLLGTGSATLNAAMAGVKRGNGNRTRPCGVDNIRFTHAAIPTGEVQMKIFLRLISLSAVLLFAGQVVAQAPQSTPTRIRGTVDSLAGNTLMVNSRDGQMLHIA